MFLKKSLPKFINSFRRIASNQDVIYQKLENQDKGLVIFGLNRPKQKNSFGKNLVNQLTESLQEVAFDNEARILIIKSTTPGIFCAGADLKERSKMQQDEVNKFVSSLRSIMTQIHKLPIPVIAALDGIALGGGLELSLACDIRVASTNVKMGLVETKLAIIPGAGGTQRLPRLINPSVAKELIYTGRIIEGKEALSLGIINHLMSQNGNGDAAFLKALEIAREILPNGPMAVRMAKAAVNRGLEVELRSGLVIEEECYSQVVPTEDRLEGLRAFKEKRRPNYLGR